MYIPHVHEQCMWLLQTTLTNEASKNALLIWTFKNKIIFIGQRDLYILYI